MDLPVLVADDDAASRTVVAAILRKGGYEVRLAVDGCEAWTILQAPSPPSIAVIDWMMPGLDGPEICRRVRTLDTPTPTYVVLLTSRDASAGHRRGPRRRRRRLRDEAAGRRTSCPRGSASAREW